MDFSGKIGLQFALDMLHQTCILLGRVRVHDQKPLGWEYEVYKKLGNTDEL